MFNNFAACRVKNESSTISPRLLHSFGVRTGLRLARDRATRSTVLHLTRSILTIAVDTDHSS